MNKIFAIKTDKTDFVFKLNFFESEDKIEIKAISSFEYMLEEKKLKQNELDRKSKNKVNN